jgi:hypothetical protein
MSRTAKGKQSYLLATPQVSAFYHFASFCMQVVDLNGAKTGNQRFCPFFFSLFSGQSPIFGSRSKTRMKTTPPPFSRTIRRFVLAAVLPAAAFAGLTQAATRLQLSVNPPTGVNEFRRPDVELGDRSGV